MKASSQNDQAQTRQQLLEAAGAVFAEVGFRNATVREICQRAQANIAAVNYHFGDKEALYMEVFRYSQEKAHERYPLVPETAPAGLTPEKRLYFFVYSLLQRIFDEGEAAWHGKLMLREMMEPTTALDFVVGEKIRPMSEQLRAIVADIIGGDPDDERVWHCSFSIVGQCTFYCHSRPVVTRLYPAQTFETEALKQLAEHITEFSLAGLKPFRAAKK
jgi:AcrR family transcriptional regulator